METAGVIKISLLIYHTLQKQTVCVNISDTCSSLPRMVNL